MTTDPANKNRAFCKLCQNSVRPRKLDLIAHKKTQKHGRLEREIDTSKQLQLSKFFKFKMMILTFNLILFVCSFGSFICILIVYSCASLDFGPIDVSDTTKKQDIVLSYYIANHASIRSIDHLGEVLNAHFIDKGNAKAELRLHRTKCAAIILNVLEPTLRDQMREEIGDSYFSIIVDESTDVGKEKRMAYCIRYFNRKLNDIVVDFLGLQVVIRTTAAVLYQNFLDFMKEFGLNLDNMIALATDGANNLCG